MPRSRYLTALLVCLVSVLMLAACLIQGCILQAGLVTLLFVIAAAMGTDAELEMRIEEMDRADMICAMAQRAESIVLQISRDRLWREYLMWELGVEDA